jgi:hypothetical protein
MRRAGKAAVGSPEQKVAAHLHASQSPKQSRGVSGRRNPRSQVLPPTGEEFAVSDDASEWKSACPHPEAVGMRWGDPISEERQAGLQAQADQQREWAANAEAERGDSLFTDVRLTGADVFWLASSALAGPDGGVVTSEQWSRAAERLRVASNAAARGAGALDLSELHLEGADLTEVHLEGTVLTRAHLETLYVNTL